MNNKMVILDKIDKLIEGKCKGCRYENVKPNKKTICNTTCPVGNELMALGDALQNNKTENVKKLLDKGEDLTTSEIIKLRKSEVTIVDLSKATGINVKDMGIIVNNLVGGRKPKLNKEDKTLINNKNFHRYLELKEAGHTLSEIAESLNVSINRIYKYNNFNNKRIDLGIKLGEVKKETNAERVLKLIEKGDTLSEVSKKLNLSMNTVRIYSYARKEEKASG